MDTFNFKHSATFLFILALFAFGSVSGQTGAPSGFNYQAVVRDTKGAIMANQPVKIRVKFTDNSGNSLYWQEDFNITTTANGLANLVLGNGTKSGGSKSNFSDISWVGNPPKVEVLLDVDGSGNYVSMGVDNFWSVPYAFVADSLASPLKTSNLADVGKTTPTTGQVLKWNGTQWVPGTDNTGGGTPGGDVSGSLTNLKVTGLQGNAISTTKPATGQILKWNGTQWQPTDTSAASSIWTKNGKNIYYNSGNVGINTSAPTSKLDIVDNSSTDTIGMTVKTSGGTNATGHYTAIYSEAKNTNGLSAGVQGRSFGKSSGVNDGIEGYASGSTNENNGISGYATGSTSPANVGIFGKADSASYNIGVSGLSNWKTTSGSSANYGIYADATGSYSSNAGVLGFADSTGLDNKGMYAQAVGATPSGGINAGIFGIANGGTYNFGVYGSSDLGSSNSYAGFFDGNVQILGTLSKSAGSFKIDDPMDPANKYLVHSFVESPDMMNVYNGNISTGSDSLATVILPDYFDTLNKDFRYQLTAIGQFAQAIVYKEVKDNQFVIKTDKPNVKVSWQVTGIRHDPYANKYPIVPVVEKTGAEKGKYLIPALYGQPADKGIGRPNRNTKPILARRNTPGR